ncbi:MAG TPA: bifunctional serine/threonine-protein kinase/formylglycine-generating enzyme family protein [Bryobacteraceae bacterium]|jgi:serine/threonine-protein kinase
MSSTAGSGTPIQLPARISKYELLEFLGGGMSHVFRARDTVLGRTVAIKILTPAGVADSDTKARFLQEARTASNISHENILSVYDFGEENGKPFMVMEFLRGRTLRAAIKEGLLPDLTFKLRVAWQVARALNYVHQNQIIHRDVKPENINLDNTGRAKLMDFGIAKSADLSLTQPGYVLGTPYYMAPEQIMGKPVTGSVDIYAFGIMLYEMVLGNRPYSGDTIETIFYKILNVPLDLSPLALAGIPPEVVAIVARCTKKDVAERYPDFAGVVTDLERALGTQNAATAAQTAAVLAKPPAAPSKMPLLAGVGGGVLALLAVGIWWVSHGSSPPEPKKPVEKKVEQPVELKARIETPTGFMRLVSGGEFLYGEDKKTGNLGPYYIDETEVSNKSYGDFCTATHREPPKLLPTLPPDLPVVDITIADARAFAQWAGKRLPKGLEWEKAARGKDGRTYPWGNEGDPTRANVADNPTRRQSGLEPVDAFGQSASPYQAVNMVGNVWELIDEPMQADAQAIQFYKSLLSPPPTATEPWVSSRGGSYKMKLVPGMVWDSQPVPERFRNDVIGFRCVKDPK